MIQVHRRLLRDDAFGVGEALNEMEYGQGLIARGKHWMFFGKKNQSPSLEGRERLVQNRVLMSNWLFFDDAASLTIDDWRTKTNVVSNLVSRQHFDYSVNFFASFRQLELQFPNKSI